MSNKRINFGPPTDSDVESEIYVSTGTASRPLLNRDRDADIAILDIFMSTPATSLHPIDLTVEDSYAAPVKGGVLNNPPIIDLTLESLHSDNEMASVVSSITTDTFRPIVSSTTSAFTRPLGVLAKRPIGSKYYIPTPPKKPKFRMRDLPSISSEKTYTSYDITTRNIMWHDLPEPRLPPVAVLKHRPRWMAAGAEFLGNCPHTKYLHQLFLRCPSKDWQPVTRSMVHSLRESLKFAPDGVADCIKLNFNTDEEILAGMDIVESYDDDDSVTITSQDSADNETMFLFRFWTSCNPQLVVFTDNELEVPGSVGLDLIDMLIHMYFLNTDY